jgi:hypothetical protein
VNSLTWRILARDSRLSSQLVLEGSDSFIWTDGQLGCAWRGEERVTVSYEYVLSMYCLYGVVRFVISLQASWNSNMDLIFKLII